MGATMSDNGFTSPPVWQMPKRGGLILAGEREYKGAVFFELRYWAEGGTKATKQGVTIPPDKVAELAAALNAYAEGRRAFPESRKAFPD